MLHVIIQPPFNEIDPPNYRCLQCAHFEVGQSTEHLKPSLVLSVIADGTELQHILKNFTGLPVAKINDNLTAETDMHWFGDDARFIVANW